MLGHVACVDRKWMWHALSGLFLMTCKDLQDDLVQPAGLQVQHTLMTGSDHGHGTTAGGKPGNKERSHLPWRY